jgi:MFS family permease
MAPFRHGLFLGLWTTNVISNIGVQTQAVGAAWLMMTLTSSPRLVALVATANLLPIFLFSLPFGAAADLYDRRQVLLAAQFAMFATSAALTVLAFCGMVNAPLLLLLTFLLGCGVALNGPAWQAAVGDVVPLNDVPAAVSLNILGINVARTVGPAVGGLVVAATGPRGAFALNAATYIGLFAVLASWRRPPAAKNTRPETIGEAIVGGVRYVSYAKGVGRIVLRAALFGLCLSSAMALMPLVAKLLLGGTPATLGVLLASAGAGAVIGAGVSGHFRERYRNEAILRGGQLLVVIATFVISVSTSTALTAAAQSVWGAGMVLCTTSFNVSMQLSVPRWVVGRAISIFQMGAFGGVAVGAWFWGAVAEASSVSAALALSAAALALVTLIGLRLPLQQSRPELLQPGARRANTQRKIGGEDAGAPVSVLLEYRIAVCNQERFLGLMRERRQIRCREGARQWALSQDANEPEIWVERFLRASWSDFLRHYERRTIEEERNLSDVRALHVGPETPRVRFFVERDVGQARAALGHIVDY